MDENPYRAPQEKPEALPVDRVRTFSIALGLLGDILLALIPRYGGWAALTVLVVLVLADWIRRRHRTG